MDLVKLNARGTIIQIPKEIVYKSEVLKTYFHKWNEKEEPYYLNYEPKIVHKLIDYLSMLDMNHIDKIKTIANELLIEFPIMPITKETKIFMSDSIIRQKYKDYKAKFDDFKDKMKLHNINIKESYKLSIFLSMMSYYEGYHMTNIYKFGINYKYKPKTEKIRTETNIDEYMLKFGELVISVENAKLIDITKQVRKEKFTTNGILFDKDHAYFIMIKINDGIKIYRQMYTHETINYVSITDLIDNEEINSTLHERFMEELGNFFSKSNAKYISHHICSHHGSDFDKIIEGEIYINKKDSDYNILNSHTYNHTISCNKYMHQN